MTWNEPPSLKSAAAPHLGQLKLSKWIRKKTWNYIAACPLKEVLPKKNHLPNAICYPNAKKTYDKKTAEDTPLWRMVCQPSILHLRALAQSLLPARQGTGWIDVYMYIHMYVYIHTYIHNKLLHITYSCTSLRAYSCIYIYLGVALGSNQWCAFQARDNGGKFFFTCHYGSLEWDESLINFKWPTSTVDLNWRSSGIKGHFQHVFTPYCRSIPHPNLAASPNQKTHCPAPLVSETNDDLLQWWSSETWGSVDREVLKFFPSQNNWRSSANPSENKTLPGIFWLRRAPTIWYSHFPILSLLTWVFILDFSGGLRSQIHLLYKSNYFWKERNRDKGISHWKLAHTSRNSKTSSAPKKNITSFH